MWTHGIQPWILDLPAEPLLLYEAQALQKLMIIIRADIYEVLTLCWVLFCALYTNSFNSHNKPIVSILQIRKLKHKEVI